MGRILIALRCHGLAALLTGMLLTPACADDLSDFNRAVEAAMSHHRVAASNLRGGNFDLATIELNGMREAWGRVSSLPRPAAFRDQERYTGVMLDVAARLIGATLVLNLGRGDVAAESLDAIRRSLSELRRQSGVTVLADCVLDANTAMAALSAQDEKPDPAADQIAAKTEAYRVTLQRCDAMAPPGLRQHAEFRRLVDGALASLAQIPKAIETRDRELMHRLLIELRAFDDLLAFHYG